MLCDTNQCINPDVTNKGTPYLYGICSQYEERCMPVGHVTRRALRLWENPLHSFISSMLLKSPLYVTKRKERMAWGAFAKRIAAITPPGPSGRGTCTKFSLVTAPNPSLRRWEILLSTKMLFFIPLYKSMAVMMSAMMHLYHHLTTFLWSLLHPPVSKGELLTRCYR